jgi:hypothetical protein
MYINRGFLMVTTNSLLVSYHNAGIPTLTYLMAALSAQFHSVIPVRRSKH